MVAASSWQEWFEVRELCVAGDGHLGRRFQFGTTGIVCFAGRFQPTGWRTGWLPAPDLLDRERFPALDRKEAESRAGASLLDAPPRIGRYPEQLRPPGQDKRVAWIDEAVLTTLELIADRAPDARQDLAMAGGHASDDYAIDNCSWFGRAFGSIAALVAERELILERAQRRRGTDHA